MLQGDEGFCNYLYQGQTLDRETGLAYNRFRYYDAEEGVYISQDPIGLLGGMELYNYVHNPNDWIDAFGLKEESYFHGKKPAYTNPGHHQPGHPNYRGGGKGKTSTIPDNAEDIYKKSIPDSQGKHWYAKDANGNVHIFRNGNDGTVHWAGSSNQGRGVEIPKDVQKRLTTPHGHSVAPAVKYL